HRGEIGPQCKIAKTLLPVGELESLMRIHLDVHRQQITATVCAVFRDLVEKELASEALADQAPEHVRARDDDGVDSAAVDLGFELGGGHGWNTLLRFTIYVFTSL